MYGSTLNKPSRNHIHDSRCDELLVGGCKFGEDGRGLQELQNCFVVDSNAP
jgi:hypothetical protein